MLCHQIYLKVFPKKTREEIREKKLKRWKRKHHKKNHKKTQQTTSIVPDSEDKTREKLFSLGKTERDVELKQTNLPKNNLEKEIL